MVLLRTRSSPLTQNKGFVNSCSFEPGITMVWRTSACGMLESDYENKVLVNCIFKSISRIAIGGWGWKRSGAESPTGNPSPAPIAIAPHASHARHDRSMARWISVARAKVGGHGFSPTRSRKVAPSPGCPFLRFEQGNIMVSLRTDSSPLTKIRVSWIYVHLSKELQWFGAHPLAECLSHQGIIRVSWIYVHLSKELQWFFNDSLPNAWFFLISMNTPRNMKSIKTASGAPRPKSAPRGSKSATFAQGKFQVSNRQKMVANPIWGTLRFTISISDILMAPSCSLRSFLEVGVSWAASRYSFRNLRFKHRGM